MGRVSVSDELKALHRDAHDLEAACAVQPEASDHEAHRIATEVGLSHHAAPGRRVEQALSNARSLSRPVAVIELAA